MAEVIKLIHKYLRHEKEKLERLAPAENIELPGLAA